MRDGISNIFKIIKDTIINENNTKVKWQKKKNESDNILFTES